MSILIFIIILGVLVFVHELGHFVFAKLFGIRVDEFGMGFPPRALRLFKRGETEYTLNWIPFGGFVKIHGEDSLEKNDPDFHRSMMAKKWWQQIVVLIAGVAMNMLVAWIIFSGLLMAGAPTRASQTSQPEELRNIQLTVLHVADQSPAQIAGIVPGDIITEATRQEVGLESMTAQAFTEFIQSGSSVEPVLVTINRNGTLRTFSVTPHQDTASQKNMIGIALDQVGIAPGLSVPRALIEGARTTGSITQGTFEAFGALITGKTPLTSLSGPVGLTGMVGDAQKIGFAYVMMLMAIISINLAVINILPFPALDGGRILFVIIETIIRRPLPQKFVQWTNGIGFLLLILLMIVVSIKDVIKLF